MNTKDFIIQERAKKISLIKDYDKSDAVNCFYCNGKPAWLDKATRVGLVNSLNMEKAAGRTDTQLWLNGEVVNLKVDDALQMLVVLELYAKDCYSATEQHIANVNKLDNLSKIHNYRYNNGYPEKLKFNI
jgi:hypothetical protein